MTLTIGQLAERSGVATSAIRFYESRGLLSSERTAGNQLRTADPGDRPGGGSPSPDGRGLGRGASIW